MTVEEEEQRIRERAYLIWDQEGRPHGRELDHRLRAEAEIAAERLRGTTLPIPITGATNVGDTRDDQGSVGRQEHSKSQRQGRGDDHERLTNARKAAEALFTGNRHAAEQSVRKGSASVGASTRQPRVLPVLQTPPADHEELKGRSGAKHQPAPKIASSQVARIRTLVKYGMTVRQVAEVYGVDVGEIERILRVR